MHEPLSLISAFLVGLLGGTHCIGMCGGIVNALSLTLPSQPRTPLAALLLFNSGRIASYSLAGVIVGLLGAVLQGGAMGLLMRGLAGAMMIAMGLYLAGWWRGLSYLERAGTVLWRYLQPLTQRLLPVRKPYQALLLGMLWGWLPCGLVYSVLTLSLSAGQWQHSALIMASFGLGTLPVMLMTGLLAQRGRAWLQSQGVRSGAALLVIVFGVWTLLAPWWMHGDHTAHTREMSQHHMH